MPSTPDAPLGKVKLRVAFRDVPTFSTDAAEPGADEVTLPIAIEAFCPGVRGPTIDSPGGLWHLEGPGRWLQQFRRSGRDR